MGEISFGVCKSFRFRWKMWIGRWATKKLQTGTVNRLFIRTKCHVKTVKVEYCFLFVSALQYMHKTKSNRSTYSLQSFWQNWQNSFFMFLSRSLVSFFYYICICLFSIGNLCGFILWLSFFFPFFASEFVQFFSPVSIRISFVALFNTLSVVVVVLRIRWSFHRIWWFFTL